MTDTTLTIRPAIPADIPTLLDGIAQLAAHHGDTTAATSQSLARDIFAPQPWMHALLATTGQSPFGYALLLPLAQAQFGLRGMDLHHLFTWPAHRGTGIGTRLIAAATAHAQTLGCTYLTVGTASDNAKAAAFYTSQGFIRRPDSPRFVLKL